MNDAVKIEAILFYKAEPVSLKYLSDVLKISHESVVAAVEDLSERRRETGIIVSVVGEEVLLGTHPDVSEILQKISASEQSGQLTKAVMETLSIIVYSGPITKGQIDFIRGVNSHFILRSLLIKGLISREHDPSDKRLFLYKPTQELFAHLGITKIHEMPEFKEFNVKIEEVSKNYNDGTTIE